MRGTQAKRLQREALSVSMGQRWVDYIKAGNNRRVIDDGIGKDGKPMKRYFDYTGTVKMAHNCTRALYRSLKSEYLRELRAA